MPQILPTGGRTNDQISPVAWLASG